MSSGLLETLPDSSLTASASYPSNAHTPQRSRFSSGYGWGKHPDDASPWLQADLGQLKTLGKVATKGRDGSHNMNQWLTSFKLSYSSSDDVFQYVLTGAGDEKVYQANFDSDTIVTHCLSNVHAVKVRLHPLTWNGACTVLWELYEIQFS